MELKVGKRTARLAGQCPFVPGQPGGGKKSWNGTHTLSLSTLGDTGGHFSGGRGEGWKDTIGKECWLEWKLWDSLWERSALGWEGWEGFGTE